MIQDKRKLLQTWVAEAENRSACESRVVVSKESANVYRGQRELVSVRDMVLQKGWPIEKIRGIIACGGGVPDPDAPDVAALTQFWCYTSHTQLEEESVRQLAQTEIAAETSAEGLGAMMQAHRGPRGGVQVNMTDDQLAEIRSSTQPPGTGLFVRGSAAQITFKSLDFFSLELRHMAIGPAAFSICTTLVLL